jgi:hypothetical protein
MHHDPLSSRAASSSECDRRTALRWLAAPLLAHAAVTRTARALDAAAPASQEAARRLVLRVRGPGDALAPFEDGVQFGMDEAGRAAGLLGVTLHLDRATEGEQRGAGPEGDRAAPVLAADAAAVVDDTAPGAVVMQLRPPACAGRLPAGTFSVAAGVARRIEALADWSLASGLHRWTIVTGDPACDEARVREVAASAAARGIVASSVAVAGATLETRLAEAVAAPGSAVCLLDSADRVAALRRQLAGVSPRVRVIGVSGPADERDGPMAGEAWVAEWHGSLARFGARELNARFVARAGRPMDSRTWLGWMAVRSVVEAALRGGDDPRAAMTRLRLDGHKGRALTFDDDGFLRQPLVVIGRETTGGAVRVLHEG